MTSTRKPLHRKARQSIYPKSDIQRFPVPDDKVDWAVEWLEYSPIDFTSSSVLAMPPWADVEIRPTNSENFLKFNSIDGNVDRKSGFGDYSLIDGIPRNPIGRTGIRGRGVLGRWGPNHAADPITTRWKRDDDGNVVSYNDNPVLEFVAIKRQDNGQWALPGGMVEAGDTVTVTLKKEFGEEAMNSLEASEVEKKEIEKMLHQLFSSGGKQIYKGYVDDPRNTDNAWMETTVVNFHDDSDSAFSHFKLKAGDDAGDVAWLEVDHKLDLYANHNDFIMAVARLHGAYY
ncbi:uncharacterized protein TRIADDRAFT_30196 [Trichoplax adhaerens]|uniref:Nudix hydrolase domain-containing protein n=1 Tax=Trichoplax adhaerens TaxID=10228 RepID=B3S685_TRIAD|nr:hypothetical protein TRIADDRAFT_30196 [Trichoplax adhaerens]EDV21714.1 hypothetical protein TRIADDRAFT_30196 [Trichoplax adhaerens]|eukprot:XP_002115862.1 hypothetical protein TRIADDRAFT_30196 [Trichoplax adhaerens]